MQSEQAVQQKTEEITMARRMTVHRDGKAIYDIVIQSSFDYLGQEVKALSVEGRKLCIVTDSNVAPLYLKQVEEQLKPFCGNVFKGNPFHSGADNPSFSG